MSHKAQIFFEDFINTSADDFSMLPQSGSARKNFIGKHQDKTYIITENQNIIENKAFFYFSEKFSELNLNTPKIFAINEDKNIYIQEFLGDKTLSQIIDNEGHSEQVKILAKQVLEKLFELQQKTQNQIDYTQTFEYEQYDDLPITHDLYYFKNFLVDVLEIPYHKGKLLREFKKIVANIENLEPKTLIIRDFQSRNILINERDKVSFIDYQSAMYGPAMYDVVSFLYQAKANFPTKWKQDFVEFYIHLWNEKHHQSLRESLPYCQLIRFLQVLGAYGFRGIIQRKAHFINSLEQGIKNLVDFWEQWGERDEYPELTAIILQLKNYNLKITLCPPA